MPSPCAVQIELIEDEREHLEFRSRRPTSAPALATRSRIVLAAADGVSNTEIAAPLAVDHGLELTAKKLRRGTYRSFASSTATSAWIETWNHDPKSRPATA